MRPSIPRPDRASAQVGTTPSSHQSTAISIDRSDDSWKASDIIELIGRHVIITSDHITGEHFEGDQFTSAEESGR
jgi:hypothetical protein